MTASFSSRKILSILAAFIFTLSILSIGVHYCRFVLGHEWLYGLVRWLDLNEENNLPTWFQSTQLLLAAVLLWVIAQHKIEAKDPSGNRWSGLAFLFFYISFDEAATLHEMFNRPLRECFHFAGYLHYGVVLIGFGIAAFIFISYWSFLLRLPRRTRILFIFAGFLYVLGAAGMEMINGKLFEESADSFRNAVFSDLEEIFEMSGIFTFVYALLSYMKTNGPSSIELRLKAN